MNAGDHRVGMKPSGRESVCVTAEALDDLFPPPTVIDVLLLDTQASEHVVLQGAERVLARSNAAILVEFWPEGLAEAGADPVEVIRGYRSAGFDVRLVEVPELDVHASATDVVEATLGIQPTRFGTLYLERRGPWWRRRGRRRRVSDLIGGGEEPGNPSARCGEQLDAADEEI